MGWPLLVLGAVAAAGGTAAQMEASHEEENSMRKAVEAELARQQKLRGEAQGATMKNIQANVPVNMLKTTGDAASQAAADYAKFSNVGASVPSQAPESSAYVAPSSQQANANKQILDAAAALQGWRSLGLNQQLGNLATNSQLGMLTNFAQGSKSILPMELQAAARSQEDLRGMGMLAQQLGSSAMMMGAGGMGGGGTGMGTLSQVGYSAPNMGMFNQYLIKKPNAASYMGYQPLGG